MEMNPSFSPTVTSYMAGYDIQGGMSSTQTLTATTDSEEASMTLTGSYISSGEIWMGEHVFNGSETIHIPAPNTRFDLKITDDGYSETYTIDVIEVVNPDPYNDPGDPIEPIGG